MLQKTISISVLYFVACEFIEYLTVRSHGRDIYPPKLSWRLIRWVGLGAAIIILGERLRGYQPQPKDTPLWVALCFLAFGAIWPRTLWIDNDGISSCSTFGLRRRFIPWSEVARIDSDWEEVRIRFGFSLMGTRIIVLSRVGTTIIHGIVQTSQSDFLDTLRRHLARDAFAPGLYDWHPNVGSKWDWSLRSSRRP